MAATAGGSSASPVNITGQANLADSLAPLLNAGTQFMAVGDETLNGVSTRHFVGQIDAAALMGGAGGGTGVPAMSLGSVQLWIDPSTKYLHKLSLDLDLAPFLRLMMGAFSGLIGTPGAGTPSPTPLPASMKISLTATFSKHNDPAVTVPAPPTDALPAPTGTPAPVMAADTATPVAASGATATPAAGGGAAATAAGGGGTAGAHLHLGDSATLGVWKVTVQSVKDIPTKDAFTPGDGMRFVGVDIVLENTTAQEHPFSATLDTQLKDSDGNTITPGIMAQLAAGFKGFGATVPAHGKVTGPVAYEVAKGAHGLEWGFKDFVTDALAVWDLGQ